MCHREAEERPAQTTILSNALMGIISGSPVANVVTTGAFAVPLMKETGYPMMTAAALLAVAATVRCSPAGHGGRGFHDR